MRGRKCSGERQQRVQVRGSKVFRWEAAKCSGERLHSARVFGLLIGSFNHSVLTVIST